MIDEQVSNTIDRPVEDVFAFVTDFSNAPQFDTDIVEARRTSSGPIGRGSAYAVRLKPFMGQSQGTADITEYEPYRRAAMRLAFSPLRPTLTYLFEPTASGTKLTVRVQSQPTGLLWLMQPIMRGVVRKRQREIANDLKSVLERRR